MRYKKDHDMRVQLEPHFSVADYVFLENPPLIASAADGMAYEGYLELLSCHIGPYHANRSGHEEAKINQRDIQNTIPII